jgi:hypothetical protein
MGNSATSNNVERERMLDVTATVSRKLRAKRNEDERPTTMDSDKNIAGKPPSQQRAEVKQAFLRRSKLRGHNLYSDGKSLWSYGWWEVARWVRGRIIIRKGRAYSRTTERKHRRGLPGTLAKTETPMEQAKMNL